MNRLVELLNLWATLNNNLRVRDRSVKALQYGCQMLLGFYSSKFNADMIEALKLLRRTASTSRKAFWLLKSVNHTSLSLRMINELMKQSFSWVVLLDLIEQIFLALYYIAENVVFLVRVKMLKITEDELEPYVNWTWFIGDLACFLAAATRFAFSFLDLYSSSIPAPQKEHAMKLRKVCFDTVAVIIAFFELVVSADYVHAFRRLLGRDLGDGFVGLSGVLSSSLIIADNAAKLILQ